MRYIYTVGFTKKTAETFFELLKDNNIDIVVDIRLNNTSQLAAFAKYPDIQYFLKEILNIEYCHDRKFSPEDYTLKKYKKKLITWNDYIIEFNETMNCRNIREYIKNNYSVNKNICLLCSEHTHEKCHRRLVAKLFYEQFEDLKIIHL